MTDIKVADGAETDAETLADKLFEDFDTDKDGVVTFEEFKAGAARDLTIVSLLECNPEAD